MLEYMWLDGKASALQPQGSAFNDWFLDIRA